MRGKILMAICELLFVAMMISARTSNGAGIKPCPNCGNVSVPYPLSTGDGCGDPDYRVYCDTNNQGLQLRTANGNSYRILNINPESQRLVIEPAAFLSNSCETQDMASGGVQLNNSLPFNITSSNTIMFVNCSPRLLLSPLNCTSTSACHSYIDQTEEAKPCRSRSSSNLCCTFVAGGSSTSHSLRLGSGDCRGYTSVINFNPALPAPQWDYGLEIQWASPQEPSCRSQQDCGENSACLRDLSTNSGESRCLCINKFHWDPISGTCATDTSPCGESGGCHRTRGPLIAGLVSGSCAVIAVAVATSVIYRRKRLVMVARARLAKERTDILSANGGGMSARLFTSKEMKKATNGFSTDRVLGSGGFGEVYKGVLKDSTVVAVKATRVGNTKGIEQVLNEVRILSQVNHRSLVRLLGCCVDTEQPLMIYEYISNGTLFDHLHTSKGIFLDWRTRLNIAVQTAEGLAYLHSSAFPPIYHRDVKSSNILLDDKLNAKVSDFGLSRLAEPDMTHISTCAQGTLGYLDPEYYRNYQLTEKSDVYSFGVVLLELVTSGKAIDFCRGADDVNLAEYVMRKSEEGNIIDVVDPRLTRDASETGLNTMKALAFLALGCLQQRRQNRPTMTEVAEEIRYIKSIEASPIADFGYGTSVEIDQAAGPLPREQG